MKCQTLAVIIVLVSVLATCGQQATEKPAEGSAASTEVVASAVDTQDSTKTPSGELPVIGAVMTHAPEAPPPADCDYPVRVTVKMETIEKVMTTVDGVKYKYWTFGGDVPGQVIRVREGDTVEVHFSNHPTSTVPHNADFHAATGTGGGAEASFTVPGHTSTFSFKALQPGLYTYHCAAVPVGTHIANGMYSLILVEPKGSPLKVDKESYVTQGDFYTRGEHNDKGLQDFDMDKAIKEQSEYVAFNGHVGSIAGDNTLKAKIGEKIRIFIGNGSPNSVSSLHVIGEVFNIVHIEDDDLTNKNIQATIVPVGGAVVIDFKVDTPGSYTLVGHSIFRAFSKGALGQLKVEDGENLVITTKKLSDTAYQPADSTAVASASAPASAPAASAAPAASSEASNASK